MTSWPAIWLDRLAGCIAVCTSVAAQLPGDSPQAFYSNTAKASSPCFFGLVGSSKGLSAMWAPMSLAGCRVPTLIPHVAGQSGDVVTPTQSYTGSKTGFARRWSLGLAACVTGSFS